MVNDCLVLVLFKSNTRKGVVGGKQLLLKFCSKFVHWKA